MKMGPVGLHLIEFFEGYRDHVYTVPGDVPTIGYGTTAAAGVVEPLPETCTREEASKWLWEDIQRNVIPAIEDAVNAGHRRYNENQIDALCSLGYNVGPGVFEQTHTIGAMIRGEWPIDDIANSFLLYEGGDGFAKLPGLISRRETERALFLRKMGTPNPGGI